MKCGRSVVDFPNVPNYKTQNFLFVLGWWALLLLSNLSLQSFSALNTLHRLTPELSLCCTLWCCHFVWHEEMKSRAWLEFKEIWMERRRAKAQVAADREGSSQDPSFFQCIRCMVLWGQMKIVYEPQSSSVIRIHATCVADVGKFGKYVLLQTMNL